MPQPSQKGTPKTGILGYDVVNEKYVVVLVDEDGKISTRALTSADVVTVVQGTAANLKAEADVTDRAARILGKVKIWDGTDVAEVDSVYPVLATIELEHHMVHEGKFYSCGYYWDDVDTTTVYFLVRAPDTSIRIHIKCAITVSQACLVQFFENPTVTTTGTAVLVYNNDRNSDGEATILCYRDGTFSADGTVLCQEYLGGERKTEIGGQVRNEAEWILKQGEDYLIKVTSQQNDTKVVITTEHYEV